MKQIKKKIGIIELDYHFEVLLNTLLIVEKLNYDLYIFTKSSIHEQLLKAGSFEGTFITPEKNESISEFLKKNEMIFNQMDLLIFDTFELYFKEIMPIRLNVRSIVRVHNAHTYFVPLRHIKFARNFFYLLVDIKYFVLSVLIGRELKHRKRFNARITGFTFPTETIRKYVIEKELVSEKKVIQTLPFTLHDPSFRKGKETESIHITFPGTVDLRRRNYAELLEAFILLKDKIKQKVELTFLGKPKHKYEQLIINKFKKIENEYIRFHSFVEWIPQKDFDACMQKTDFFIVPLYEYVKFRIYNERYGYSKISGNINDIVKYGKPALVSEKYPLEPHLERIVQRYNTPQQLAEYLLDWIENRTFKKLNTNIPETLKYYHLDNVRSTTKKILNDLLE